MVVAVLCLPVIILILFIAGVLWVISSMTEAVNWLRQRKSSAWNTILQFEPIVGWKVQPNLDTHYLALDNEVCHIMTDSQGCVGNSSLSESDMVVFGDSFAFGYGVDSCDAYFNLTTNLKIKAISAPGYSMVQELLLMREFASSLCNKIVVWFICLENDLYDNLQTNSLHPQHVYRRPFLRRTHVDQKWKIITSHVDETSWPYPSLKSSYAEVFARLCTPGPLSKNTYSSCDYLLREGRELCSKAGAQLAVMTIPNKLQLSQSGLKQIVSKLSNAEGFDPDYPDKQFQDMCNRLSIPFLPAKNHLRLQDYKEFDWHWDKQGQRKISQLLSDIHAGCTNGKF